MEARDAVRTSPLLDACQVAPDIFEQVLPRLEAFMKPFVSIFQGQAATHQAQTSVGGLLSNVEHKNIASIADRFGQSRLPLQGFIGCDAWEDAPVRQEVQGHIRRHVGQGDGVVVFDPSGFPTSGRESGGVARQWCGRLGTVDTCQVAISLGSVSRKGHALGDTRLSLPQDGTKETARVDKAGVPTTSRASRTRPQLVVEMLADHSAALPHRWSAGEDEMGRPSWFRQRLAALHERYLLAVPSTTSLRDLETALPEYGGKGRRPTRPWHSVPAWSQTLDASAWQRLEVRDGAKGPLVVEIVTRRVVSRNHRRQQGDEEVLAVIRSWDRDQEQIVTVDSSLSHAAPETALEELARVAQADHRIEACLQRGKSETGLAD